MLFPSRRFPDALLPVRLGRQAAALGVICLAVIAACSGDDEAAGRSPGSIVDTSNDAGSSVRPGPPGLPSPGGGNDGGWLDARPGDGSDSQPDAGSNGSPDASAPSPDASGTAGGTRPRVKEWPPVQTSLRQYRLTIAPSDLALLNDALDRTLQVPATFEYAGVSYPALARYRGRSALNFPKKSFDLELTAGRFEGRNHVVLVGEWKDGGYLTEKMWYDLAAAAGLRVPWTRYVELTLNGSPYGVMVEFEKVNKSFLLNHAFHDDSDIYRCGQNDCELRDDAPDPDQDPWEKKTNELEPWDALWSFLRSVNHVPTHEFEAFAERQVELEDYVTWLAVDAAIANSGVEDSRSYVIRDRFTNRWTYVPWDLNNAHSLFNRTDPLNQAPSVSKPLLNYTIYNSHVPPHWNVLATRIFDHPPLRARVLSALRELMAGPFRAEIIGPRAQATSALLAPALARDPFVDRAYAERAADYLTAYVTQRRPVLEREMAELESLHGATPLKVDRVGRDAAGAWFVDLVNLSSQAQPLRGLWLTGKLRAPTQSAAPALTLAPGEVVRLHEAAADSALLLRATIDPAHPEFALFRSDGAKPIDAVFLPLLAPGESYGREPRGSESWSGSSTASAP